VTQSCCQCFRRSPRNQRINLGQSNPFIRIAPIISLIARRQSWVNHLIVHQLYRARPIDERGRAGVTTRQKVECLRKITLFFQCESSIKENRKPNYHKDKVKIYRLANQWRAPKVIRRFWGHNLNLRRVWQEKQPFLKTRIIAVRLNGRILISRKYRLKSQILSRPNIAHPQAIALTKRKRLSTKGSSFYSRNPATTSQTRSKTWPKTPSESNSKNSFQ